MDKISGWELVAAFSLVGVLLIAILIVLLTLLLSNVVKNKIISNKGAKNWVKQTPSTYKKQPEHHQGNGNLTNSQELVNARGMNGDVVEFPKEDMRGRETDVRVKEEEKQKKLFFPLSNKGFFLKKALFFLFVILSIKLNKLIAEYLYIFTVLMCDLLGGYRNFGVGSNSKLI